MSSSVCDNAHRASARANLIGSLWMVVAMAGFAVEDSLLKVASAQLPVSQVLVLFGCLGMALFVAFATVQGDKLFVPETRVRSMQIRMGFEIFGRLFFVLAIALAPLSAATVILQATPLVVVAGAALVFGEKVGILRIFAIVIGFIGVLIVLQPGAESFTWSAILAVLGMLGFAGRDLASRAAPKTLSTAVLGVYGYLALLFAGGLYALWETPQFVVPSLETMLALILASLVGAFSYVSLMNAMRTGEVSAVAPFRYSRLLFGIGLGVFWFGEAFTQPMFLGSGLIVCAGMFLLWSGRRAR
ncbi:EamA family transporter [Epibacterium sp. SM1969]|uniref:EamA family transporter n=2 Tax=Tritonibacter aquimaris TaxID=2663379 RepID=A0A844AMW7_9RHOB|nr:EamA family transporter [Tritonibacter aquimaris]